MVGARPLRVDDEKSDQTRAKLAQESPSCQVYVHATKLILFLQSDLPNSLIAGFHSSGRLKLRGHRHRGAMNTVAFEP